MRQLSEGDGWHRGMQTQGGFKRLHERRLFRVDPELVVHALNQPPAGSQLPRDLHEDLVLLVGPGELRIAARLAVVVPQMLVSREEPQPIANRRTADVRREVAVCGTFVAACPLAGSVRQLYRLAGQPGGLPVVRGVIQKPLASLPGDDVDD